MIRLDPEERRIAEFRELRDTALDVVQDDLDDLKAGLEREGLVDRAKHKVSGEISGVLSHAKDVASDNRAVVGATLALLLAWLMRRPIMDLVGPLFGIERNQDDDEAVDAEED